MKTSVIIEQLGDPKAYAERLKMIREAGFNAVDAALFTPDVVEIIKSPNALGYAGELRKITEDSGLEIAQCHPVLCPMYTCWEETIRLSEKTIPFVAALGANYPVIHPICPLDIHDPLFGQDPSVVFDLNCKMYSRLVPIAADNGISILIENLFADGPVRDAVPCWSTYAADLNQLMDAFPGLYICFDNGHAEITGQHSADVLRALGSRVRAVHLHGNDHIQDLHLTPFEKTDMGWESLCGALKEIGYAGTINLEVLSFVRNTPEPLLGAMYAYLHACAAYLAEMTENA